MDSITSRKGVKAFLRGDDEVVIQYAGKEFSVNVTGVNMEIKCNGKLTIEAQDLELKSSVGNVEVKSRKDLSLMSGVEGTGKKQTNMASLLAKEDGQLSLNFKSNFALEGAGSGKIKAKDLALESTGNLALKSAGRFALNSSADVALDSAGRFALKSSADLALESVGELQAKSLTELRLQGTAKAALLSSGITDVKGALVKIN